MCTYYDWKVKGDSTGEIDFYYRCAGKIELGIIVVWYNPYVMDLKVNWNKKFKFFINNYYLYIKRLVSLPYRVLLNFALLVTKKKLCSMKKKRDLVKLKLTFPKIVIKETISKEEIVNSLVNDTNVQ